jgi:hypothetical protein
MLAVSDIGGGVAADRIWHVFGSFFTTKEVGKGILSYPPDEGLVWVAPLLLWVICRRTTSRRKTPASGALADEFSAKADTLIFNVGFRG